MAISVVGNYENIYENVYNSQKKEKEISKDTLNDTSISREDSNQKYLKKLQSKVSYVELETGLGLSTKRDNKMGTVTINPKLLEKMQNDPEAEKKYTQMIKDIETAEKTAISYYNALGGCVERTSHWYIDENGKYYHFAFTRRDDRLNKKLREEAKKNAEKQIEVTRKKVREKAEKLKEKAEERLLEKLSKSDNGEVYFNDEEIKTIIAASKEIQENQPEKKSAYREQAGANLDVKI